MGRRGAWRDIQHERERQARKQTNPVWRGVGCLLVIVMGALGWAFANWFIAAGLIYFPPQLISPPDPIPAFLSGGNLIRIVATILFALTAFGVINFVYAILFPVKPGEHDLPTPRRSPATRRKRRGGRR